MTCFRKTRVGPNAGQPPHPKLKALEQDITDAVKPIDAAVAEQNYESAEKLSGELTTKVVDADMQVLKPVP
jgi:hypothetical protein